MSNINISVTEQDPINVSIASPEVQNVDVTAQSISASVPDGDKGDIVVTGNGSIWTLDPNALATRVPYTGATADVDLGEFGLLTGNIEFDTSPTNAPTGAGSMVWNNTEGTADLMLRGASVNLPIGQKQVVRAVNGTGGNLTRAAYRAVKITGAQGQRLQVSLARADNDANSKDTIGLVAEDITNNQTGFIVSSGTITNINTTGSLQGETWADGDTLYLSGTTSGVITNVKPTAPTHTVILGFVVYAHQNNGKIYVKPDNGYELDELHNVNVSTKASGDYLRYNGTLWVDSTIQAADLPTGIDAAKIGTGVVSNTEFGYLDGVTSAIQTQLNGKQATLTNPVTGVGTSGQVTYFSGTSAVTGSNNLFWDATNNRLGINTASPAYGLEVVGTFRTSSDFRFGGNIIPEQQNTYVTTSVSNGYTGLNLRPNGTATLSFIACYAANDVSNAGYIQLGSNASIISAKTGTGSIQDLKFQVGSNVALRVNANASAGVLTIDSANVGIGTTSPSYKLDISGTLRNTTDAYFATSSGDVRIGTTTGTVSAGFTFLTINGSSYGALELRNGGALRSTMYHDGSNLTFTASSGGMALGTAGAERVRITTTGSVGIGTTSPTNKLMVIAGNSSGFNLSYDASGNNRTGIFAWTNGSSSGGIGGGVEQTSDSVFTARSTSASYVSFGSGNIRFQADSSLTTGNTYTPTTRLLINAGGNVSIGNTNNTYNLDVSGTLRNTTDAYFATSSGSVGVGTTTLTSGVILNVAGVSEFRGDVYFGKSSATNHTSYYFNASSTNRGQIGYDATNQNLRIESTYGGSGSYTSITLWTGNAERVRISEVGNFGIGQTTFGTSATKTFAVSSGTAPTTSPADAFQMYSADITAGNAAAHFRTEGGAVIKLYQQTTGVAAAAFVQNSVNAVYEDSTFGGYTLKQVVKALQNAGFLA
jgi:hypothetical protein